MYDLLKGIRIVEGASFIAGPICCQHLVQFGAEVIRFDMIGGGPDYNRWPISPEGDSLYWEGHKKGKKSVAIDLSSTEGRALAIEIATAPGDDRGMFVTNYPVKGFLSHEKLAEVRPDLITIRVMGWADGRNSVDYTLNAVTGFPMMTGPAELSADRPVNHVLPAWDLITGSYAAFSLVAAERQRRLTGQGGEIRIPLSDIAATTIANLGQLAEVSVSGQDRPRSGNDLFGALGRDFVTKDNKRLIAVAMTFRQWTTLVKALNLKAYETRLEQELGVSFEGESERFTHRSRIFEIVQAKIGLMTHSDVATCFDDAGVLWNTYRTLTESISEERGFVRDNPVFSQHQHPSGYSYPTPSAAATIPGKDRAMPGFAPRLGEHTDQVLQELLGFSTRKITELHDRGIVSRPSK